MSNNQNKNNGDILDLAIDQLIMKPLEFVIELTVSLINEIIDFIFGNGDTNKNNSSVEKVEFKELLNRAKKSEIDESLGVIQAPKSLKNKELLFKDFNNSVPLSLVVGAPGSGKTYYMLNSARNEIMNNKSVVFIDPKGSKKAEDQFVKMVQHYNKLYGREKKVFTFSPGSKDVFNPFQSLDSTQCAEIITQHMKSSNEFYKSEAKQAVASAVHKINKNNDIVSYKNIFKVIEKSLEYIPLFNFNNADKILELSEFKEYEKKWRLLLRKLKHSDASESDEYKNFQKTVNRHIAANNKIIDEKRKNLNGLITYLKLTVEDPVFGKNFDPDCAESYVATIRKIRENGDCAYISLPTTGYFDKARSIGDAFIMEISNNVFEIINRSDCDNYAKKNPLFVFVDEAGDMITPSIKPVVSQCREAGVFFTFGSQTVSDFQNVAPNFFKQLLSYCYNFTTFKLEGEEAVWFSSYVGTREIMKKTKVVDEVETMTMGTEREGHDFVIHPDTVKRLPQFMAIIKEKNKDMPTFLNTKDIGTLECFKG